MNMAREFSNEGIPPRAREQAEYWLVRQLDSDARAKRHADFERWLAADPMHAAAYREAEGLWALGVEAARHPDVVAAARRAAHVPSPHAARAWFAPAFAIASLLMMLAVVGISWRSAPDQVVVGYATRTGEQKTVNLRDGSSMFLDTDSAVSVRDGSDTVAVDLLRGRVEFQVRHRPGRLFVVRAGGGVVTDVGTTFQVGVGSEGNIDVVLIEGSVAVAAPHAKVMLTSGEALLYSRAGIVEPVHRADLQAAVAWTHGEIAARGWRLSRLLAEMNRYSDTKVEVQGRELDHVRITGAFRAGDQKTLVKVLETGWPIRARFVSPTRVVLSRD